MTEQSEYVCPECGLVGVCPIGWVHTSASDQLLSVLGDQDRRERAEVEA